MEPNKLSLFDIVERFAKEEPDKSLFADHERDYSASDFYYASLEAASLFKQAGVKEKELVFLRATRTIDTMIYYTGLVYIGAVVALLDAHQSVAESIKITGFEGKVAYVLTDEEKEGEWKLVELKTKKTTDCPIFLGKDHKGVDVSLCKDIYSPSTIIFTSGSSSKPKAVGLSQYNLMNHLQNHASRGLGKPEDVVIMLLPIHHVFGLTHLLIAIWYRYRLYFAPSLDLETTLQAIAKEKVTGVDSIPAFVYAIAKAKAERGLDLPSPRLSLVGGTNLIDEELDYIEQNLNVRVVPVYGLSECIGIAGASFEDPFEVRRKSCGKVLPMCEVKLIDEDGNDVTKSGVGEIIVKAPSVMVGYYGDEVATKAAIDENGFLHTGDMGRFDEQECLHIVGRKKEIIIRNGVNLSPATIEAKIMNTGFFVEVAVVGIDDKDKGEVPAVVVVVKKDVMRKMSMTEQDIARILKESLLKIEYPAVTKIMKSLPHLSSGKIDKIALKKALSRN